MQDNRDPQKMGIEIIKIFKKGHIVDSLQLLQVHVLNVVNITEDK